MNAMTDGIACFLQGEGYVPVPVVEMVPVPEVSESFPEGAPVVNLVRSPYTPPAGESTHFTPGGREDNIVVEVGHVILLHAKEMKLLLRTRL